MKCTFILSLPFQNDNEATKHTHKSVKFLVIQLCHSSLLSPTEQAHFHTRYHATSTHFINKNNVLDGRSPLLWCNLSTQQCDITAHVATSQCFFYFINANLNEDDANLGFTCSKTLKVCSKHLRPKFCRWFVICRTYSGQPSGSKTDNYSQPSSIVILLGNYLLFLSSIPSHHMS